jgi:hypothetical protein
MIEKKAKIIHLQLLQSESFFSLTAFLSSAHFNISPIPLRALKLINSAEFTIQLTPFQNQKHLFS